MPSATIRGGPSANRTACVTNSPRQIDQLARTDRVKLPNSRNFVWRYRELFRVFAWRDLTVRYKQTVIFAAWGERRLFITMLVFTVIFGRIAKLPTDGNGPLSPNGFREHASLDVLFGGVVRGVQEPMMRI